MSDETPFERARQRLIKEARAWLKGQQSTAEFFGAFMKMVSDLAGENGLDGIDLYVFQRLADWERAPLPG